MFIFKSFKISLFIVVKSCVLTHGNFMSHPEFLSKESVGHSVVSDSL